MKLEISPEDFVLHGSYHFSYPLLAERYKRGEPLISATTPLNDNASTPSEPVKNKVKKTIGQDDYDLEDPFIDDAQVTAQYKSVFQLLSESGNSADSTIKKEEEEDVNFYVYRGPLEVDIIQREFEPPRKGKRKRIKNNNNNNKRKSSKNEPSEKKKSKSSPKAKPVKSNNLLNLTEQLKELEEKEITDGLKMKNFKESKPKTQKKNNTSPSTIQRRQYDTDNQVAICELQDALEEFNKQASLIPQYDSAKFPHALRPFLEVVLLSQLRINPNFLGWEDDLFHKLAKSVPYPPTSLKKLSLNKVLPLLLPSDEKLSNSLRVINNEARLIVDAGKVIEGKAKFSEALREAVFLHVRLETTKVIVERALKIPFEVASDDNNNDTTTNVTDINLQEVKRAAFKNICEYWPSERWPITSGDISKEFSAFKRKLDQRILKKHKISLNDIVITPNNKPRVKESLGEALFADDRQRVETLREEDAIAVNTQDQLSAPSLNTSTAVVYHESNNNEI